MRKQMTEMRDADVKFLSLVDKSSSRIPFRILKHDDTGETMLDLSSIRRKSNPADETTATVTGVVVQNHKSEADNARIKAAVKAAGFSVEKPIAKDDGATILFAQEDAPLKDAVLVRMSDQLVLAVKGFQPQHPDMKEADFGASASANGFYQGLDSSLDVFFSKVCDAVQAAKSEVDAAGSVAKLCDGLKAYAVSMVKGLPAAAFKADTAIRDISADMEKTAAQKADITNISDFMGKLQTPPKSFTGGPDTWAGMSANDKLNWMLDSTNKPQPAPDVAGSTKTKAEDCEKCKAMSGWDAMSADDKTAAHAKHVEKSEEPKPDAAVLKALEGLTTSISTITGGLTTLTTKVDAMEVAQKASQEKVEATATSVSTLTTKMESLVAAPPPPDNFSALGSGLPRHTEKSDDARTGTFDTAFMPNRGRARR